MLLNFDYLLIKTEVYNGLGNLSIYNKSDYTIDEIIYSYSDNGKIITDKILYMAAHTDKSLVAIFLGTDAGNYSGKILSIKCKALGIN